MTTNGERRRKRNKEEEQEWRTRYL